MAEAPLRAVQLGRAHPEVEEDAAQGVEALLLGHLAEGVEAGPAHRGPIAEGRQRQEAAATAAGITVEAEDGEVVGPPRGGPRLPPPPTVASTTVPGGTGVRSPTTSSTITGRWPKGSGCGSLIGWPSASSPPRGTRPSAAPRPDVFVGDVSPDRRRRQRAE